MTDLDALTALLAAATAKYRAFADGLTASKKGGESPVHDLAITELRREADAIEAGLPALIEAARREAELDTERLAALLHAVEDPDIGEGPSLKQRQKAAAILALLHDNAGAATPGATEPE